MHLIKDYKTEITKTSRKIGPIRMRKGNGLKMMQTNITLCVNYISIKKTADVLKGKRKWPRTDKDVRLIRQRH